MNTSKSSPRLGLQGRVQVAVTNPVRGERIYPFQPNLILDQGLDQIASTYICDIFRTAAKGIGSGGVTTATKEIVPGGNSFTMTNGSTTITRSAGTRDFTSADEGRLVKFAGTGFETTITGYTDATHVEAYPAPSVTETAQDIVLHYVEQTALDGETGRSSVCSLGTNENKTTTVAEVRTFKRTFLFDGENVLTETPQFTNFYSQTGTTVTRTQGTRDFVIGDVGKQIHYRSNGWTVTIVSLTDVDEVEVTPALSAPEQCIDLIEEDDLKETPAGTNTYSRLGNVVTRDAGTRDFTANDVGKIIHFLTAGTETTITVFNSATSVDVADTGAVATQNIDLYEFRDYTEIGFSHTEESGDNINIRVKLASPVRVNGATALTPSDQLKVTYELDLTVSPSTEQTGNLGAIIVDPGGDMSGNKNGKFAIESFATSTVATSGDTVTSFAYLEPAIEGYLGISTNSGAIDPLSDKERSAGVVTTPFVGAEYVPGEFSRTYTGVFALNQAIGTLWLSLMLYDPNTDNAIFTFLFNHTQTKDTTHSLSMTLTKTWGRDLA